MPRLITYREIRRQRDFQFRWMSGLRLLSSSLFRMIFSRSTLVVVGFRAGFSVNARFSYPDAELLIDTTKVAVG